MKIRYIIVSILFLALSGAAYAAVAPQEDEYADMQELRKKIVRMKREMDTLMKDIVGTSPSEVLSAAGDFGQDVKVDVIDNPKEIIVRADLPGMDKDKIEATLEGDRTLKISGTRDVVKKETAPGMVRQERSYGRFERVLQLPSECKPEGIKAVYKNGVLEITIPKKEKTKEEAVKIAVQ